MTEIDKNYKSEFGGLSMHVELKKRFEKAFGSIVDDPDVQMDIIEEMISNACIVLALVRYWLDDIIDDKEYWSIALRNNERDCDLLSEAERILTHVELMAKSNLSYQEWSMQRYKEFKGNIWEIMEVGVDY